MNTLPTSRHPRTHLSRRLEATAARALGLAGMSFQLLGASLGVEQSPNLQDWTPRPVSPAQVSPQGEVIVPAAEASGFYRLTIQRGTGPVVALADVPDAALRVGRDFVDRLNEGLASPEGNLDQDLPAGERVDLGPIAALYFDPLAGPGSGPSHVEFKLVRVPAGPSAPAAGAVFGGGPQETDSRPEAGYVTVSATRDDFPVSAHSQQGSARFERLLARVPRGARVRLVRYDDVFAVAEDAAGRVVASLGSAPYIPDPQLLTIPADGLELATGTAAWPPVLGPRVVATAAESYEGFKQAWRENPVFRTIRAARATAAADAWEYEGDGPKTIEITLRETRVLNTAARPALRAESSDPSVIRVEVGTASGLVEATGLAEGDALVTLWYQDGSRERCIVEANATRSGGNRGAAPAKTWIPGKRAGWAMTGEVMTSNWPEQPRYDQILKDPSMCPTTVSGCGPTAWAMFYGYWDRKGYTQALGDITKVDAPLVQHNPPQSSILACTRWVFQSVDQICFPKLDRAATLPTMMHLGEQWAGSRSLPLTGSLRTGVPYLSPSCQKMALESINIGRPSIVGIGFYAHYPLAYGYRKLEWKTRKGTTLRRTQDLRLNMGWGSGHVPEWRNIEQLWYATNLRPQ